MKLLRLVVFVTAMAACFCACASAFDQFSILEKELKSPNAQKRAYALVGLAHIGDARGYKLALSALNDKEMSVREKAVEAVATIDPYKAVAPLSRALQDGEYWVARRAAENLGELKDPRAIAPLVKAVVSSKAVSREAAAALAKIGGPKVISSLSEALKSDKPGGAAFALSLMGKDGVPALIKAASSKYNRVRADACSALGNTADKTAVPVLVKVATKDKNQNVKHAALQALAKLDGSAARPLLIGILKNPKCPRKVRTDTAVIIHNEAVRECAPDLISLISDKDAEIADYCLDALGRIKDPAAVYPILRYAAARVNAEQGSDESRGVFEALWEIGTAGVEPLLQALNDKDQKIRKMAAVLVVPMIIQNPTALNAILNSNDSEIRGCGAAFLSQTTSELPAISDLLPLLKSNHSETRAAAARAIGRKRDTTACDALAALVSDNEPAVRQSAGVALAELGDNRAAPELRRMLDSEDANEQLEALKGLKSLPDPSVFDKLAAHLQDPDRELQEAAIRALAATKDSRAAKLIAGLLKDPDQRVLTVAIDALAVMKDPSTMDSLIAIILDDRIRDDRREAVARAMCEMKDPRAIPALLAAAQKNGSDVLYYFGAVSEIEGKDAADAFAALLTDRQAKSEVKSEAAQYLAASADPRALPRLIEDSRKKGSTEREPAIMALSHYRDKQAIDALIKALDDDEMGVRQNAAWALAQIRKPETDKAIMNGLWAWDMDIIAGAAEYIVGKGIEEAIPQLIALMDNNDGRVDATGILLYSREPRLVDAAKQWLIKNPPEKAEVQPTGLSSAEPANDEGALYRWGELK